MHRTIQAGAALSHALSFLWITLACACGDSTHETPAPFSGRLQQADAAVVSARNVRLNWSPQPELTVHIERAEGDAGFVEVARRPASVARFLDLALTPETTYRYRLALCSASGCGDPTDLPPVTTPSTELPQFDIVVPSQGTADDIVLLGVATLANDLRNEAHLAALDRSGKVLWEYARHEENTGPATEVQPLSSGLLAAGLNTHLSILDLDGTEVLRYTGNTMHHDVDELSDGRLVFLTFDPIPTDDPAVTILGDGIELFDPTTGTADWNWLARDHIPLSDANQEDLATDAFGLGHDWTHSNAVVFDEANSKVYVNVRNLDRLLCIDVPSGQILWSMGTGGDFGEGLWAHSHDPQFLSDNRFVMFDNGFRRPGGEPAHSRVIEVEFDVQQQQAQVVWEYRETPDFFTPAQGAVQVQPDGNYFVTAGFTSRVFEINREGKIVWEMRIGDASWSYKAVTVSRSLFEAW